MTNGRGEGRRTAGSAQLEPKGLWQRLDRTGEIRPRLSAAQIADAAVAIADRSGLATLSMRKVAEALGAGTMSLYHYVKTRDELLLLMHDTVIGELDLPPAPTDDWRSEMVRISTRMRAVAVRHPWISELPFPADPGPNFSKLRAYLRQVDYQGLRVNQAIDLIRTVLAFVHGVIAMEASEQAAIGATPQRPDDRFAEAGGDDFEHDAMFNRQLGYVLSGLEAELINPARTRGTSN